ncbi:efflux transporter outer membrane subunit [Luteimonas sp. RIT-PG2_3]
MVTRLLVSTLATALLAACAVGPEHVRPTMAVADSFGAAPVAGAVTHAAVSNDALAPAGAADDAFWRAFGDPQLDALVDDALLANHDLRIALANHDRVQALLRGTRLDRLPTLTGTAEASTRRASGDQAPGVTSRARDVDSYSAGIEAAWELDLFGRVRRNVEAGGAEAAASEADLRAMQVVIVSEVARQYANLRGVQERLRVAEANVDNQRETARIVQSRLDAGRGTDFDTARARAQLDTTQARIPALQAEQSATLNRLAVLTGRMPEALDATLGARAPLPWVPAMIDPGTPGALLRRRPDIAAAEHRLHAATARIGVATADLFPRFTLGGLIGTQATDSSALFERGSETRLVALGIDWSFLDVGRVRARIAAADADAEGALARYEQTVLTAVEDTENSLVRHARTREEDAYLQRAAQDSANAARIARLRYEAGAGELLEVLDAERTQWQAEDAFADARTRTVTSAVALYRALAGGWPTLPTRVPVASRGD